MQDIILEILEALEAKPYHKILDFGCGGAELVKFINQQGFTCYGTDIQAEAIHRAKKEFLNNELDPNLLQAIPIQRDGYTIKSQKFKLPFEDNFFDTIISFQVFEHVDNIDEVIDELHRICKQGAKIYLEFPSSYVFLEPHPNIPLVQHLRFSSFREKYIYLCARFKKINNAKSYAKVQNHYLKTSCFYRSHKQFDQSFINKGFKQINFSLTRRSLRFKKDKVHTLQELISYKQRKYNKQSRQTSFNLSVKIYLHIHSFFYALFVNRILIFIKEK